MSKAAVYEAEKRHFMSGVDITLETFKNELKGKKERARMLVPIFKEHNRKIKELLNIEYAPGTLERYEIPLKHTVNFLKWKYNLSNINIEKIDHGFIHEYEFYLRSQRKCANNTAVKYIKNFYKIINQCLANDWLRKDPFINYKAKLKEVIREYLTEGDLQKDFELQFKNNKYNFVLISSTNIDRIFALYHDSKNAKRCFICDSYQTNILKIVSGNYKHYTKFYDIDFNQTTSPAGRFFEIKRQGHNPFSFDGKLKLYLEKYGFCMLIRSNDSYEPLIEEYSKLSDSKIYYSMWNGYLDCKKPAFNESLYNFMEPYKIEFMHTSGHADLETLKTVFEAVKPKCGIIPIYTEATEKFKELFHEQNTIILLNDGDVYDCNMKRIDHD